MPHILSTSDCRVGTEGSRTELTEEAREDRPATDALVLVLEFVRARPMAAAAALLPRLRV